VSASALLLKQTRFTNRAFWRNPASAFFTFAFPLLFLVIFTTLFGRSGQLSINGNRVSVASFYIPAIAVFAVINACYTNVAISLTFARDTGVLKRIRGTPLPAWAFLGGRILHAAFVGVLLVAICSIFGAFFYGADLPGRSLPAFLLILVVGSASFCALGMAVTTIIPNADASPAVVNATILPLLFLSDVFIPLQDPPEWVDMVGKIFPVRHFSDAMQYAFFPPQGVSGVRASNLSAIVAWGLFGLLVAVWKFSWEPRR
jgi:ABC-2 type transport system permease protein